MNIMEKKSNLNAYIEKLENALEQVEITSIKNIYLDYTEGINKLVMCFGCIRKIEWECIYVVMGAVLV